MNVYNVLLTGVGGQGIITIGQIILESALREGKNAVMSEVHGMAQRGGSVVSEVRIGDVLSPMIPSGEADMVIGLELVEPLRYANKIGDKTIILVNNDRILPLPTLLGEEEYPSTEDIIKELKNLSRNVYIINGTKLALEAGSALSLNIVMLGAAIALGLPIEVETVRKVLKDRFKGKVLEINEKALDLGIKVIRSLQEKLD